MNTSSASETSAPEIAPATGQLPSGPALLSWAVSFYQSHFSLIFGIALIPFLIGVIAAVGEDTLPGLAYLFIILTSIFVSFLFRAALFSAVLGSSATIGDAYRKGLRIIISFAWVTALVGVVSMGGALLFLIPGIMLSVWLSLSLYVLMVEGKRGTEALAMSWWYVKGYWWALFWRYIFIGIITLALFFVVVFVTSALISVGGGLESSGSATEEAPLAADIFQLFIMFIVAIPLGIIYSYGIYNALRKIKETDPEEAQIRKYKKYSKIFIGLGVVGYILFVALVAFVFIMAVTKGIDLTPHISPQEPPASSLTPLIDMTASLLQTFK